MAARKDLEKYRSATRTCEYCGLIFGRNDKPGVIYSAFMRLKFCSQACSQLASRNDPEDYFLNHTEVTPEGCWNWTGPLNSKGYGILHTEGGKTYAHRYSLIRSGVSLGNLHALHSCDNPQCVNPHHLRAGTHAENMQDASIRNRFRPKVGERSCKAKLTEAQAMEISSSSETGSHLAKKFGVSRSTIYAIRRRQNWGHLHASA